MIAIFVLVGMAFFLLSASFSMPVHATFTHDFLYKFWSYWSDVTTDGAFLYVTNSAYSQIDKYSVGGVHQTSNWGGYGTALGKLKQPMGIYRVGTNLYVADTGNHRIQRFDSSTGVADSSWGSFGSNNGQFNEPEGVAVDSAQTYLFVADTKNNRIQAILIADGSVASVAGTLGNGENQFSSPKGIAVTGSSPNLTVYVADTGNNRIMVYNFNTSSEVFTLTPHTPTQWGVGTYGTGNGQFNQPNKITVDDDGYFYVTDTTNRIQKFDNGRNFIRQWSVHDSKGTTGLTTYTAGSTTLYVIEPYHQIDVYNAQFGIYDSSFTDESNQPVDIAIDTSGNIYINNETTDTVQKFNSSWIPQAEWGGTPGTATNFSNALGIGVNTGGEVCVADTGNNRVLKFDTNGTYMATLPTPEVTPVGFNGPKDVAFELTGKMFIADTTNNRILKYKSDNTYEDAFGLPTPTFSVGAGTPTPVAPTGAFFLNPYGITVDTQNKIYVADSGHHRILKFDAQGRVPTAGVVAWGEYGSADDRPEPQFDNPQGMAIENTANLSEYYIYVADTGNNRIQRFNQDGVKDPNTEVWGVYGTGDGQFNQPRNIALDPSKRIYVSEVANRRVQVFGTASLNAGLTVVQTSGTAVTEDGSVYDSFTVKLKTQPTASVSVDITSSDSAQLTVSSSSLTFTQYNWNVPQVVTVLPVQDYVDQPNTTPPPSILLTLATTSLDPNYNSDGATVESVNVAYTDTDTAGITFSKTSVNVNEDGTSESYTMVLNSKPTANVDVVITSADGQTLSNTYSPLTVTFTPTGDTAWNIPKTITVSAVHDYIANGNRDSYITFATNTTDTSGYATVTFPTFVAHITDATDVAGVNLSTSTQALTEGASTSPIYLVWLNSKPESDVTITVATPEATTDVGILPTTLTFTADNYNTAQGVTIWAPNDHIVNPTAQRDVDITHTASSSDPNYGASVPFSGGGGADSNLVTATITDIDQAGIVLNKSSVTVTEGQTEDTYTIALNSKPTSDILFELSLPSTFEATTSAYTYTFTPSNWNVPQTVTVSSTNNDIYSGTHSATLIHTIRVSSDANYAAGTTATISVTVIDTDTPGLTINQPNGVINLTEYGVDDLYYIKLKTQPLANVVVAIDGASQVTATPLTLTFTPVNWGAYQIATLSAVNDYIVEGTHTAPVIHTTTSTDAGYNGLTSTLTVNITDDDNTVPGVQLTQTDGGTEVTEGGVEDTYTMVLTSKPTAYVRIRVLSDNQEATTSGALFTFFPTNWNVPQTVHVIAKNDTVVDGDKTTIFRHILTSPDPHYNAMSVETITVTSHDNDGASAGSAANAKPPTCGMTPPSSVPHLFQIDSRSNSATLYFTPIRDNISYYFIAYGYKPGDIRFGVSFDMGSYDGVIDYTINALNPGETYYYKVRGGNGCATGEWSNTLAGTATASGSASVRTTYAPAQTSYAASSGGSSGGSSGASHPTFTRNMYLGTRGADVRSLQMYLNQQGFTVAQSGAGSPGNETDYYGPLTASAIRRFQEAHFAEILSPLGYSSGTGIFGPSTRNYVNSH